MFDLDHIEGFISGNIWRLIRVCTVCGVEDERAWEPLNDIIFLDPVTTRNMSHVQQMWLHYRMRCSPVGEWWADIRSQTGQIFDNTRDRMNNLFWDTDVPSGTKSITRIRRQPDRWRLNTLVSVSHCTVAMISAQGLSCHGGGSTGEVTSWPVDYWIEVR